jgi:hypothetical protein
LRSSIIFNSKPIFTESFSYSLFTFPTLIYKTTLRGRALAGNITNLVKSVVNYPQLIISSWKKSLQIKFVLFLYLKYNLQYNFFDKSYKYQKISYLAIDHFTVPSAILSSNKAFASKQDLTMIPASSRLMSHLVVCIQLPSIIWCACDMYIFRRLTVAECKLQDATLVCCQRVAMKAVVNTFYD